MGRAVIVTSTLCIPTFCVSGESAKENHFSTLILAIFYEIGPIINNHVDMMLIFPI